MPTQEQEDIARLRMMLVWGLEMSKDPARKLGACIVGADGRSVSMGYNGLPSRVPDTPENWARPRKYELVIHAEMNALDSAPFDVRGGVVYCTLKPCHLCMGRLVNAGIRRAVWFADPIPFVNQNAEIFDLVSERIQTWEYPLDTFSQQIIDLYGHQHDGYVSQLAAA